MAPIRVLLIEDNDSHAMIVRRHLRSIASRRFELIHKLTLAEGVECAREQDVDVVLLDLGLPDTPDPAQTLSTFLDAAPDLPVIVLTAQEDPDVAVQSVQQGAQDNLAKTHVNPELLYRSISYAIERKRSQQEAHRYALELERSNRDFQHFAHYAAHELKSPLWSVSLTAEILRDTLGDALDDDSSEMLEGMVKAVGQMTQLINDLLEFSRVESRGNPPKPVSLEETLAEVRAAIKADIEATGAQISQDELPTIAADGAQIAQVLRNLIVNAIKYRGPCAPNIHVSAQRDGKCWRFAVRDNGVGVPPQFHEKIFGMFERLQGHKESGSGIGLAICKRIVERHGGRIGVESQEGVGSTFYFTIPDELPESMTGVAKDFSEPVPEHSATH